MTASLAAVGALHGAAAGFTDSGQTSTGEAVLFWVLAPLMVLGALGLLFARKAIYAAMGIVFVMICLAVLYIAQEAPFLGVVQVVVYTGAIMMLFLFVLMLVGVDASDSLTETLRGQRWLGLVFGIGLAAVLIAAVTRVTYPLPTGLAVPNADSNPVGVARIIFGDFIFAFEVVGILLVTAAVGALVLTHRQRLTRRIGQKERADSRVARMAQGESLAPLPAPGVFARTNAMDVPALDPYGRPIEHSVSRVLRIRGQEREFEPFAAEIDDDEGGATVQVPLPPAAEPGETTGPSTTITTGRGPEVQP
jgi:NADH-quinone oxidoreductase subunit J